MRGLSIRPATIALWASSLPEFSREFRTTRPKGIARHPRGVSRSSRRQTYREGPGVVPGRRSSPSDRLHEGQDERHDGKRASAVVHVANPSPRNTRSVWRLRRRQGRHRLRQSALHLRRSDDRAAGTAGRPPFWRTQPLQPPDALLALSHDGGESARVRGGDALRSPRSYIEGYPSSHPSARRTRDARSRPSPRARSSVLGDLPLVGVAARVPPQGHRRRPSATKIYDRYGTSEFAVSMTGCQRGATSTSTWSSGSVEVEVDGRDGRMGAWRAPRDRASANDATPFIRYRVGDVGTRSKRPCPCGRPGRGLPRRRWPDRGLRGHAGRTLDRPNGSRVQGAARRSPRPRSSRRTASAVRGVDRAARVLFDAARRGRCSFAEIRIATRCTEIRVDLERVDARFRESRMVSSGPSSPGWVASRHKRVSRWTGERDDSCRAGLAASPSYAGISLRPGVPGRDYPEIDAPARRSPPR